MAPSIDDHHDLEEQIMFPYYQKLGAEFPHRQSEDHKALMALLDELKSKSAKLLDSVKDNKGIESDILEQQSELKTLFRKFHKLLLDHFAEEETYWPPIVKQFGEKSFRKVLTSTHHYIV